MSGISRRTLLQTAAGLLPARTLLTGTDPIRYANALGVQLYTVRRALPQKAAETFKALEQIGYAEVEATQDNLEAIWPSLLKTSLKPVSLHLDPAMLIGAGQKDLPKLLDDAKSRSFEYIVFPWLEPRDRGGLDVFHKLAGKLNRAGAACRSAGLRFCYHNHAFEFQPMGGTTPLEVLMTETERNLVGLELDVFWVSVAGHDPTALLKRYSGRVHLVHLKDKARGTPPQFNEVLPDAAYRPLGEGELKFQPILDAAAAAGAQHYFVEQDECQGNPLDCLRRSFEYLQKLTFSRGAA